MMFDPLHIPNVWRAKSLAAAACVESTGFDALDVALGGGWPKPAMIELLTDVYGIGELQLILPLLRALQAHAQTPALIAWLNPPYEPNAVALAQQRLLSGPHWLIRPASTSHALWAMEQSLKCGACAAVLSWLPALTMPSLRRLKLAASSGHTYALLYRPTASAAEPSPAQVRLILSARRSGLHIRVLKARTREPSDVIVDVDACRLRAGGPA